MKKFIIVLPVYNDWSSLIKLLDQINSSIGAIKNIEAKCVVVNDASTEPAPTINVPFNLKSIKIINMKKNQGHARCNAHGIRYLSKSEDFDYVIFMDSDGEDRPEEIKLLVNKALSNEGTSVVAKRVKRSEGIFFQFLYQIHKIITLIFTGKNINFGNYSCLTKTDIKILSEKKSLWSSFSGSVKKHISNLNTIDSIRGVRYFGPSKMSLLKLIIHSLSIIAVFKKIVFVRSVIFIIIVSFFTLNANFIVVAIQMMLVTFNLLIYLVSLREKSEEFANSHKNEESVMEYIH